MLIAKLMQLLVFKLVQCSNFNGKSNKRFAFKNFLVQFKNYTSNMASDSARLTSLRTYNY